MRRITTLGTGYRGPCLYVNTSIFLLKWLSLGRWPLTFSGVPEARFLEPVQLLRRLGSVPRLIPLLLDVPNKEL